MGAVEQGASFVVTRDGIPVADLVPHRRATFVRAKEVVAAFAGCPPIDFDRLNLRL